MVLGKNNKRGHTACGHEEATTTHVRLSCNILAIWQFLTTVKCKNLQKECTKKWHKSLQIQHEQQDVTVVVILTLFILNIEYCY